jgi:ribosomal protein S18 acetylase RimI-like enzyme
MEGRMSDSLYYREIKYVIDDRQLMAKDFLYLAQKVWRGSYNKEMTQDALGKTINITAWNDGVLIGCVRILTDGYYFGTIPEIFVMPEYQKRGIGKKLMELAWEASPTSLFFGAQPGNETFFEKLDFTKSIQSYVKKKQRNL